MKSKMKLNLKIILSVFLVFLSLTATAQDVRENLGFH